MAFPKRKIARVLKMIKQSAVRIQISAPGKHKTRGGVLPNATLWNILETGSKKANIPARFALKKSFGAKYKKGVRAIIRERKGKSPRKLRKNLELLTRVSLVTRIRRRLPPKNAVATLRSKQGNIPYIDRGVLVKSIKIKVSQIKL